MLQYQTTLLLVAILSLAVAAKTKPKAVEDLRSITLQPAGKGYSASLEIQHHAIKIRPELQSGRSWVKEAKCKVCKNSQEECSQPCASDKSMPMISCDSAMCQKGDDYADEERGIEGEETQMFVKIGKELVLMPLVLVNKMQQATQNNGCFNIFDSDSSFEHGLLFKGPKGTMQLVNYKYLDTKELIEKVRVKEQKSITWLGSQFKASELKITSLLVREKNMIHSSETDAQMAPLEFSLTIPGISLPASLLTKVHQFMLTTYFEGKACRFMPGKLKCHQKLSMEQLFETIIDFRFESFILSLPFQLLFSGCSFNECTCILEKHQFGQQIILGQALWQVYSLQYDLANKNLTWMRKDNPWNDLYDSTLVNPQKVGYLYALFILLYHILRQTFIVIFWLALFSLAINCLIHWKKVLKYFRDILVKRKAMRLAQNDPQHQEDYSMKPARRIEKLPSALEDSENL